MDFASRYGPYALVTGASSGIGAEFARQLAARGLDLLLCARRLDRLEALAEELAARHRVNAVPIAVDLSAPDALEVVERAAAGHAVGLLVNNAGFGHKVPFVGSDRATQIRMLDTNCRAPLLLTHAFGEKMVARGRGGIVFTSSLAAFQGLPFNAHYAATKGWELQLAEGLAHELAPHGVDVVALCPGATESEAAERTGVDRSRVPAGFMPAEPVVAAALRSLGRRTIVIPGLANQLTYAAVRLVPRGVAAALGGRIIRRVIGV